MHDFGQIVIVFYNMKNLFRPNNHVKYIIALRILQDRLVLSAVSLKTLQDTRCHYWHGDAEVQCWKMDMVSPCSRRTCASSMDGSWWEHLAKSDTGGFLPVNSDGVPEDQIP